MQPRVYTRPSPPARSRWVPGLILLLTFLASLAQFGEPWLGGLRAAAVFAFLLLCPGAALLGLVRLDRTTWAVLSVALSLALLTLVSEAVILAGVWPLEAGFWVLVGVSVLGATAQLLRRPPQRGDVPGR